MNVAKRVFSGVVFAGAATYPFDDIYMRGVWRWNSWSDDRFDQFHGGCHDAWRTKSEALRQGAMLHGHYLSTLRAPKNNSVKSNLYLVRGYSMLGLEIDAQVPLTPCMTEEEVWVIWNQVEANRKERMWPWWRWYFTNK